MTATKVISKQFKKKNELSIDKKVDKAIKRAREHWTLNHKGDLNNYLNKKGWTLSEIQETLEVGKVIEHNAPNYINPGNRLIRVENIKLGKSLILDIDANQVIQLGKPSYVW